MKNLTILVLILFIPIAVNAQFGSENIISTQAQGPVSIVVADIDNDTFLDVITGSRFLNEVAWFKNEDGLGNFGSLQLILASDEIIRVKVADLDGDNDLDIIVAANFLNRFFWLENLDGLGNFGPQRVIDNNADSANEAIGVDIDGDGDMDVVGAISNDSSAVWYENLDGLGNFGPRNTISFNLLACRAVFAADIDNDGDMDDVANSGDQVTISWFENTDGLGTFGAQQVIAGAVSYVTDVFCSDIDGDGNLDVVGVTNDDFGTVSWYENTDGLGDFGPRQIITLGALNGRSIFCADLDNDGDSDLLFGSTTSPIIENSEVAWCENLDGLGTFGPKQVIGNELQFTNEVYAADIDNDGDLDVFATSQNNDKIVWYENLTILSVSEKALQNIKIYPNPVQTTLFIENTSDIPLSMVRILDAKGQTVLQKEGAVTTLDISQLATGLYVVQLENSQGEKKTEKLVKE